MTKDGRNFTYKIVEEKPDPMDSVIEKSGLTAKFTLREIAANRKQLDRLHKELKGQKMIADAKIVNIETNHPWTKELDAEKRFTVHMLEEAYSMTRVCEAKIKEIEEALEEDQASERDIQDQIGIAIPLEALETVSKPEENKKPKTPGGPLDLTSTDA